MSTSLDLAASAGAAAAGFVALTDDERRRAEESLALLRERSRDHPAFTDEDREFIGAQLAMAKGGVVRRDALADVADLLARLDTAGGGYVEGKEPTQGDDSAP